MNEKFIIEIRGENGAIVKAEVDLEEDIELPIDMRNPVKMRIREKTLKEKIIDLPFQIHPSMNELQSIGYHQAIEDVLEILEDYDLS